MNITVERKSGNVTTILNITRSWGSYDDERGLATEDFVMCYSVHMTAKTPNGRRLEYYRVGNKVLIDEK